MAPVRFLTDEWAEALTHACNDDQQFRTTLRKRNALLGFHVPDAPQGEVDYYLHVRAGSASVGIGAPPQDPDLTLTTSYDVSERLVRGTLTGQTAMMTKQISCDVNRLKLMRFVHVLAERNRVEMTLDIEF